MGRSTARKGTKPTARQGSKPTTRQGSKRTARIPSAVLLICGVVLVTAGFGLQPLVGVGLFVILLSWVHRALRIPLLVLGVLCILVGVLMLLDFLGGSLVLVGQALPAGAELGGLPGR